MQSPQSLVGGELRPEAPEEHEVLSRKSLIYFPAAARSRRPGERITWMLVPVSVDAATMVHGTSRYVETTRARDG